MKNSYIILLVLLFVASSAIAQEKVKKKISKSFQKEVKKKNVHNGFLQIQSGDSIINWQFIGGQFIDGETVTKANPFHSTSVGKMFTASVIMMLEEKGEIALEDSLSIHLDNATLKGLHVYEGVDYSRGITIKQLLQHTSGLPDYIMDKPRNGAKSMFELLFENPDKTWTTEEMLSFTKENLSAHFPPGEGYNYTDTEYILLGLILEEHFNAPLHEIFKNELFIPLQMERSSMYKRSSPLVQTSRMAEFYIEETDISTFNSLTLDWAGGGLVTTTSDLLKFQKALFQGELVQDSTLKKMQQWHPESKGTYYGLGLRKYELKAFSKLLPDLTLIGHSGISSSFSFYCPEMDLYFAGTFNQTEEMKEAIKFLFTNVTRLYYEERKEQSATD